MRKHVMLEKKIGETPLETLQAWKRGHPSYANVPVAYAGRLDPMASGKLLILLGEECKKMSSYTGLDKEYEVEVLLGVGSDTGDILGITTRTDTPALVTRTEITKALATMVGTHTLPYPAFSSKTVAGKPLFLYALEGTLPTIEVPTHEETIYSITLATYETAPARELQDRVSDLLARAPVSTELSKALGADFRIKDVKESWAKVFASSHQETYQVLRLRVRCGSGTYMRTLAGRIGKALGTRALALSIHRTSLGVHSRVLGIILPTWLSWRGSNT